MPQPPWPELEAGGSAGSVAIEEGVRGHLAPPRSAGRVREGPDNKLKQMTPYQTLYRKYRSQTFSDLVGQEAASRAIQGAITFNADGDTSQKIVSIYSFDPTTKDWKFETQVDYAAK